MREEFLKTLWLLRFQKIRKNEEDAAWKYQEILNRLLHEEESGGQALHLLERLVEDERSHERLAEELIRICHRSHPECAALFS